MKTINRKLSIRLAIVLEDIKTEYCYKPDLVDRIPNTYFVSKGYMEGVGYIKTLTLGEAIDHIRLNLSLSYRIVLDFYGIFFRISLLPEGNKLTKAEKDLGINFTAQEKNSDKFYTIMELIEKMLEYLIDNDLLGKKK